MNDGSQWGWDLRQGRAVPWDERGPSEQILGPYPSKEAAENWRTRIDERNEAWDDDDERWEHRPSADDE